MLDQRMEAVAARAILIATGHNVFEDHDAWKEVSDRYQLASRNGDVSHLPSSVAEAFRIAQSVTAAVLPAANPAVVIEWVKEDDRTWTAAIADGWDARVRQSLGDGTWSYVVNRSGNCYLDSRETAIRLAEEDARKRIAEAIRYSARTSRAFSLSLPIENHEAAA